MKLESKNRENQIFHISFLFWWLLLLLLNRHFSLWACFSLFTKFQVKFQHYTTALSTGPLWTVHGRRCSGTIPWCNADPWQTSRTWSAQKLKIYISEFHLRKISFILMATNSAANTFLYSYRFKKVKSSLISLFESKHHNQFIPPVWTQSFPSVHNVKIFVYLYEIYFK